MHCVDGWEGYKGWHGFGDTMSVENPQWLANFGITQDMIDPATGKYTGALPAIKDLTLQQAVELSLIHSRDYQTQLENVYLNALTVTFQRFQFGVRYLGVVGEPGADLLTTVSPDGTSANDSTRLTSRFGISQVLPSGAQWIVELSNNTLWLFGGGGSTSTASLLSYQITQPLFFGAGRKVVLEALTQAERNLLYAVRDLARFRQQLFTDVVATNGAISYLGLLQSQQQIFNQIENLRRLQQQVVKLQTNAERGRVVPSAFFAPAVVNNVEEVPPYLRDDQIPEPLRGLFWYDLADQRLRWRSETPMSAEQSAAIRALSDDELFQAAVTDLVRQVRDPVNSLDVLQILSQYSQQENNLRNAERNFQDNLDAYKIELGLPPTIPLTLNVSLLEQFELIAPEILQFEREADQEFSVIWGTAVGVPDPNVVEGDLYDLEKVRSVARQFDDLVSRIRSEVVARLEGELETLAEMIPQRLEELEDEENRRRLQVDFDRDRRVFTLSVKDFEAIESQAKVLEEQLALSRVDNTVLQNNHASIKDSQESLIRFVRTMAVLEVGIRAEMIRVNPFEIRDEARCIDLALQNRVDLMNARADVMDARRLVEVAANRLQAALALTAEGDFGTANPQNPLSFDVDQQEFRFGVQFRAPLDQIAERNAYRTSLINYQRARRSYMLFEDQVKQQVRRALRGMLVQEKNLETARGAVRRAALQYDSTNEQTDDPNRAAQAASGTGGVQGNNVLQALNAILNAQNQLISSWVDYERNRLNIYRDMGIMDVGPDGLWNDPFYRASLNDSRPAVPPNTIPFPTPADPRSGSGDDGSGFGRSIDAPDLPTIPQP
jgi:outer membrane protein TolC